MLARKLSVLCFCLPLSLGVPSAAQEQAKPAAAQSRDSAYVLEPGDTIEMKFFYNSELNEVAQIRPDGRMSMPLLNELTVAGQTIASLTQQLRSRYQDILRQPELTIQVRSYANRRVFVGGEVLRPGMIQLVGNQTVLSAIMESGGLVRTSARGYATLIRRSPAGQPVTYRVSLGESVNRSDNAAGVLLQPFDIVLVNRSGVAKANQAIDQYIRQMMPILLTGGFTYLFNGGVLVR